MHIIRLITCFFVFYAANAQKKTDYVLTENLNKKYIERVGNQFTAQKVIKNISYDTLIKSGSKTRSKDYNVALLEVESAKEVISKIKKENSVLLSRNIELKKVKSNIVSFLNSNKDFDSKKQLLVEAQRISDKYNLNHSLYADNEINSKFKAKFFVLSKKSIELKIYLKRILSNINPELKEVKSLEIAEANLVKAETALKSTKKYIIRPGKKQIKTKMTYQVKSFVFKPELALIGNFSEIGSYYLKPELESENRLISIIEAEKKGFSAKDFQFGKTYVLIENVNDQKLYLVSSDYIDTIRLNQGALQEVSFKNN